MRPHCHWELRMMRMQTEHSLFPLLLYSLHGYIPYLTLPTTLLLLWLPHTAAMATTNMMAIAIKTIETCDSYCYNYDATTVTCQPRPSRISFHQIQDFLLPQPQFLLLLVHLPSSQWLPTQKNYSCLCRHSDSFSPFYLLSLLFKKKKNCNTKVSLSKQKNLNFRQDWESVIGGDHIFLVHAFSILSRVQSLSLCIPNGTPSGY